MKKPLTAKVIAGHRAAYGVRLTNELCFDLARRHTSHLLSLDCREALRQLDILNAPPVRRWDGTILKNGDNGNQPSEAAQRQRGFAAIQAREVRSVVVGHYQKIAAALICERRQPLWPNEQKILAKKISAVRERRSRQKGFPPVAERLLRNLRRLGKKSFFTKMEGTMQRYVRANVGRERWSSSLPLPYVLAQEWLRDNKRLWKFIDAVLMRWEKDVADPRSVHRRSTVLHQTACDHRHDWKRAAAHMEKIKAFAPTAVDVPHLLREMSCDESAKALAKITKQLERAKLSPAKLDEEIQKRVGRIRGDSKARAQHAV